jgi:hypothetical protein
MPATLATVAAITKEIYTGKIRNQLQDEAVGWKRIQTTAEGVTTVVGGKYVTFPIRVTRNAGIGYRNEGEALQASGQQGYTSVRIGLKYGYGRVKLNGQLFKLVKTDYQAFASALEQEMTGLKNDLAKDTSRIFYGDGTGTMATVTGSSSTTTITVTNSQYLEQGQIVDVLSSNGSVTRVASATINSVTTTTYPAATVVLSAAVTGSVTGDIIVRTGNYGREPNGLGSLVTATGTLFNVDPTVYPQWAAIVDSNAGVGRALSEGLMIRNTDNVRIKGGKTSLILYSLGVRRAYFNLLSQQRRYPSTTSFDGGLSGLTFHNGREIPCVEDVDCPYQTMYGLEEDSFKIYQDEDWSWMDEDDQIWKWVTGFDAYEAVINKYWEIGINRRNANFKLADITEG